MLPPSELRARILAAARAEASLTRGHVRRRDWCALGISLAAALGVFWAFGAARLAPRPLTLVVVTVSGGLSVAMLALRLGIARGRSTVGPSRRQLALTTFVTPIALLALKGGASAEVTGMSRPWPERPGFRCFYLSCACLVVPLLCFFWARRGTALEHGTWRGVAAGAAIGACVWALVDLNCPVGYVPHLLLGHVLPLLMASALGGALGRPLLLLRSR